MCRCHPAEDGAPGEDHDGQEFPDREFDEDVSDQGLEDQLGEVDDGAEP